MTIPGVETLPPPNMLRRKPIAELEKSAEVTRWSSAERPVSSMLCTPNVVPLAKKPSAGFSTMRILRRTARSTIAAAIPFWDLLKRLAASSALMFSSGSY